MRLSGGRGHLGYCTNIHPGESWEEVRVILDREVPRVRAQLGRAGSFGVGLRLAAAAADALADPGALAELSRILAARDLYVFTINGFPHGAFHRTTVKENVYRPDWAEPERLRYANRLADLLSRLPDAGDAFASISTVPGAFKPRAAEPGVIAAIVDNLIRHAAYLVRLEAETGRTIVLALEPEPWCLLETTAETVAFFEEQLFAEAGVGRMAALAGLAPSAAERVLRRHLGVCLDACHAAVEFEDPLAAVDRLEAAGIAIAKLQLSCGLALAPVTPDLIAALAAFDDRVYLHQVVERRSEEGASRHLARFLDLPEALATVGAAARGGAVAEREWRVHFHVPIFRAELPPFASTQGFLEALLRRHRERPIAPHLEVETYTWDVLPAAYRDEDTSVAIARELAWVLERLAP